MSNNMTGLVNAWKNQAASKAKIKWRPAPNLGQKIESSVSPIKRSIGLRYWTNIKPTFANKAS